jgi:uncharacterized membrane protein
VGENERWASIIAGTGLLAYGLARRDRKGLGFAALGTALAWRGASGHCGFYQALGINTVKRGYEKGTGSKAGLSYEQGIRVDREIRINRPVEDLYRFWRNFENLPHFMDNLDSVCARDNRVSHWVVRGPRGYKVEWDAEIVNEVENKLIGWRSLPGSQVENGGSVHFEPTGTGETIVRVALQYNPPAGGVGAAVSRWLGEDPAEMIRQDLRRFKELMETGTVTAGSAGRSAAKDSRWSEDRRRMDEDSDSSSSEESIPASDAPTRTPEVL